MGCCERCAARKAVFERENGSFSTASSQYFCSVCRIGERCSGLSSTSLFCLGKSSGPWFRCRQLRQPQPPNKASRYRAEKEQQHHVD